MKFDSRAIAVSIALLVAGCGGGGGGGGGGDTSPPAQNPPVVVDTATFAGTRNDFSIARAGSGYTVTDKRTNAVTNVGSTITTLRFTDITINLTVGSKAATMGSAGVNALVDLYIASLSRVPDADSLASLITRHSAGTTMAQIADELYAQAVVHPALTGYSSAMTKTSDFVEAVYKNAFGRTGATAPTAGDVATWSARIDTDGITRGALILDMVNSARSGSGTLGGDATVVSLLNNKLTVGKYFAIEQGINYNSRDDSRNWRTSISLAVTSSDTTAAITLINMTDTSFNLTAN